LPLFGGGNGEVAKAGGDPFEGRLESRGGGGVSFDEGTNIGPFLSDLGSSGSQLLGDLDQTVGVGRSGVGHHEGDTGKRQHREEHIEQELPHAIFSEEVGAGSGVTLTRGATAMHLDEWHSPNVGRMQRLPFKGWGQSVAAASPGESVTGQVAKVARPEF